MLLISKLGVTECCILKVKKVRICKGYLYSNAPNLMLFLSDIYRYIQIQINNVSVDISLFKLMGALYTNSVILRKNLIWNTLDIDWPHIKELVNNKEMRLLPLLTILVMHKHKIR